MLNPGILIGNRYQINEKIGAGGMSDVYRAVDTTLGREVAIKVLKQEFAEDANFVSKFRAEATSAAGLEHPNIVNIYDVGSDIGLHYIVMEYVEGITLKTYIEKKIRLNYKEAISIAIQVGRGIEAAHSKGIIHRDIKPQNIMISREGKVKVTDFGIARAATANTIHGDVMGSVHYASPEQTRNGYVDGKSDIYSLGIVMYEMVTGRVPFDGESTVAVALKHLQNEMVPASVYAPDLPSSLEKIIQKATMKNADRRYATIDELLSDLKMSLQNPDGDFVVIQEAAGEVTKRMPGLQPAQEMPTERVVLSENRYVAESNPYAYRAEPVSNVPQYESQYQEPDESEWDDESQDYQDEDDDEVYYEDDDFDDEPKSMLDKIFTIMGLSAGVIIIIIIGVLIGNMLGVIKGNNDGSKVTMANVSGLTVESALDKLYDLGLTSANIEIAYEEIPAGSNANPGTVAKQSVAGRESFSLSDVMKITVYKESAAGASAGATSEPSQNASDGAHVTLPNVVGYTEDNAMSALKDLGLKPARTYQYDENVEIGNVVSMSPSGDTQVLNGATVNLVISKGSARVTVPNVVGLTEADATALLEAEGLNVSGDTKIVPSSPQEEGVVLEQSLAADRVVENGASVTLTVGGGASAYEYSFTIDCPSAAFNGATYTIAETGATKNISAFGHETFRLAGVETITVTFDWNDYEGTQTETKTIKGTLIQ